MQTSVHDQGPHPHRHAAVRFWLFGEISPRDLQLVAPQLVLVVDLVGSQQHFPPGLGWGGIAQTAQSSSFSRAWRPARLAGGGSSCAPQRLPALPPSRRAKCSQKTRNEPAAAELWPTNSLLRRKLSAHPDHHCVSSEDVQGTEVYGAGGKNIGEIDHLISTRCQVAWPMPS